MLKVQEASFKMTANVKKQGAEEAKLKKTEHWRTCNDNYLQRRALKWQRA